MTWKQLKVFKARRTCYNCRLYRRCNEDGLLTKKRSACGLWEAIK